MVPDEPPAAAVIGADEPPAAAVARADDVPPWPLWSAPVGVVLGFLFAAMATVVVQLVATGGSSGAKLGPAATIISDIVFDLGFVVAAAWLASYRGRVSPTAFGYRRVAVPTALWAVVGAAVAYYGVTAVYGALIKTHQVDRLPSDLGVTHSTAALIAAAIFVCAIAPIAEEFFFRGFLFGALRHIPLRVGGRDAGVGIAAIITGMLFGAAHLGSAPAVYLIPLGFLGFVLCMIRWWTGSLYPCMALHSANNALALGVNQLSWSAPAIAGLILGSWLLVGAVTWPLGARSTAIA